jgi:type IV pilus assembly protein PilC
MGSYYQRRGHAGTCRVTYIKNMKLRRIYWNKRGLIILFERLDLYVSSGLTLTRSVELLEHGLDKKQREVMAEINESLKNGNRFADCLRDRVRLPESILSLIEHGEMSGRLSLALCEVKLLLEREDELLKKCISAMIYPLVIGIFALGLTLFLMRGIMPQIIPMLTSLHTPLPPLTIMVIFISNILMKYGMYICLFFVSIIIGFSFTVKKFHSVKSFIQGSTQKIPIIGTLYCNYFLSLFVRSLGSLINSGMSLPRAFSFSTRAISLLPLRRVCVREAPYIEQGQSLGIIFSRIPNLPVYIAPLILAGEVSGTLGKSLIRCSEIIDRDIENSLKKVTSLIEPLMMIGMGSIVGAISLSIMMPIYDISKVLQH